MAGTALHHLTLSLCSAVILTQAFQPPLKLLVLQGLSPSGCAVHSSPPHAAHPYQGFATDQQLLQAPEPLCDGP